jgi:hypothetical protein
VDYFINKKELEGKKIYIWGDSQLYDALNLDTLNKYYPNTFVSASKPGNGVYDFLLFAYKVERNSKCIIQISKQLSIRKYNLDRNLSGLSFKAIYTLLLNGYPLKEIIRIVGINIKPQKLFSSQYNCNKPIINTELQKKYYPQVYKYYTENNKYIDTKLKVYALGFDILKEKNCKVCFIVLPRTSSIQWLTRTSNIGSKQYKFDSTLFNDFSINNFLYLSISDSMFYDLVHLNGKGCEKFTDFFIDNIDTSFKKTTCFYIKNSSTSN